MRTKVAKLIEIRRMDIFTEELPALREREVLIKMKAVGICGSDLHYFLEGGLGSFKEKLPIDIGHEPAGIIADSNKSRWFKDGDRVAIEPMCACLHCHYCLQGLHNLCQNGTFMGAQGQPGAYREYMIIKESQLVKIDDNISFEEGALLEPMAVAYHALNLIDFKLHASAAVFGVGPIGLCVLNMIKRSGAGRTFVIDKLEYRVKFASSLGAGHAFLEHPDIIKVIKDNTNGLGVDVAIDAAGMQKTVDECFQAVKPGGKVVLIGIPTYDYLQYNPHKARIKELAIFNVRRSNQTLDICSEIFKEDKMPPLVTHRFNLENIQKAFELAAGYQDGVIKAMIVI